VGGGGGGGDQIAAGTAKRFATIRYGELRELTTTLKEPGRVPTKRRTSDLGEKRGVQFKEGSVRGYWG